MYGARKPPNSAIALIAPIDAAAATAPAPARYALDIAQNGGSVRIQAKGSQRDHDHLQQRRVERGRQGDEASAASSEPIR